MHHQAILINQKWHLPVWMSLKWKVASHSRLLYSLRTEWRLRPFQDSHVLGPYFTSTHNSILIICIRNKPHHRTLPEIGGPFSSQAVHLKPGEDLKVSFGLSWDEEKPHPQLSMFLSQFTSIWVLLRGLENRTGIILSSGNTVMPSCHQRENDKSDDGTLLSPQRL